MNKKKGFTLVEVLAVVIVLGVISVIIYPVLNGILEDNRKKAFEQSLNGIARSAEMYKAANNNKFEVMEYDDENLELSYEKWEKHVNEESARFDNFLTGVGGVLYPPNCFTNEVLREDIFLKSAPKADDIWLWIMAVVHNRKIRVVKNHIKTLIAVNLIEQLIGTTLYKENRLGKNNEQLDNLLKFYKQNIVSKF